ncbi:MAG: hypothetical protein PF541_17395, partial [Prolixibacteraceae bacterium]|nr:hypothetical protein [Prolixibacteraceae bacterium]
IIVFIASGITYAQKTIKIDEFNNQEINTVFKKNKRDGLYLSLATGYSPINGDNGVVVSTRGGWIMDHWFAFGVFGSGFANNLNNIDNYFYSSSKVELSLSGGYGGFFIEPMAFPLKPIHLSFPILFGAGGVASSDNTYDLHENVDVFYVVEPGLELEINFTKWMRIALYGTYRYTSVLDIENISKNALRSYSAGVNVKIGLF